MKYLFFVIVMAVNMHARSQTSIANGDRPLAMANGSITIPVLQSLNIGVHENGIIQFNDGTNLDQGVLLPNFFSANIVSTVPFMLDVMATNEHFTADNAGNTALVPINILKIRSSNGVFMPLATRAQALVISNIDKLRSQFQFDLQVEPGWNYPGGQYNATVVFTLTPQ